MQQEKLNISFPFGRFYPCLEDRFAGGGKVKGHYFHQDLLVAHKIFLNNPERHVDIGSRVDGFVAHVASFRKIEVLDIRENPGNLINIIFIKKDLMDTIDGSFENYCDSLSCLHALEHFGLGRYGDPIRFDGYIIGINNMHKMLKQNGKVYISVPVGPQRIEFNAHRVFSIGHLLDIFNEKFVIDSFSYVNDQGYLHKDIELTEKEVKNNFGCFYGCGIFEMTKV
jgi:hypothetical protein